MPEGDTIRFLATRIDRALAGHVVTRCVTRDARLSGVDFAGARLERADAYGKHLFVYFDTGEVLHSHLLMTGSFAVGRPSRLPAWKRRVELTFEHGMLTGEQVPILERIKVADVAVITSRLGPDLCGAERPDADEIAARLQHDPAQPLAGVLLDQRLVAGFGNIYANELPFLVGLNPSAPIGSIEGLRSLIEVGTGFIRYNATTGYQNTTGRKLATPDRYIYGRRGERCPICGDRVAGFSEQQSPWGRSSSWCTTCQPLTAATVDDARLRRLTALHPGARKR
jgi:endonuclease VIII